MILMESVLKGSAQNWSNQLMAKAEARLQISYYNEAFNIWEPVIEPVLHEHTGWQSWQLRLKVFNEFRLFNIFWHFRLAQKRRKKSYNPKNRDHPLQKQW
jgi:hypothetical protein